MVLRLVLEPVVLRLYFHFVFLWNFAFLFIVLGHVGLNTMKLVHLCYVDGTFVNLFVQGDGGFKRVAAGDAQGGWWSMCAWRRAAWDDACVLGGDGDFGRGGVLGMQSPGGTYAGREGPVRVHPLCTPANHRSTGIGDMRSLDSFGYSVIHPSVMPGAGTLSLNCMATLTLTRMM